MSGEASAAGGGYIRVASLSYDADENAVKSFFEENGCEGIQEVRISRFQDTGKHRGACHVEFETAEQALKALEMNGAEHLGRTLRIEVVGPPRSRQPGAGEGRPARGASEKPPGCKSVFVGNLPWSATEEGVAAFFSECGTVSGVRILFTEQGRSKGMGFVDFEEEGAAERAVALAGRDFDGRPVRVDFSGGAGRNPGGLSARPRSDRRGRARFGERGAQR
eukprot:tig00021127_g18715.t1